MHSHENQAVRGWLAGAVAECWEANACFVHARGRAQLPSTYAATSPFEQRRGEEACAHTRVVLMASAWGGQRMGQVLDRARHLHHARTAPNWVNAASFLPCCFQVRRSGYDGRFERVSTRPRPRQVRTDGRRRRRRQSISFVFCRGGVSFTGREKRYHSRRQKTGSHLLSAVFLPIFLFF